MEDQNKFYFQPSNLLPADSSHPDYSRLYAKIPLVCLLGWAGARDQNLKKYANIYSSLGYHTIRFSPSDKLSFFASEQTHKSYADEFLHLLKSKYKLTENPIFVQMFSNASGNYLNHKVVQILSTGFN